jgi:long-chain acyl-CoA synthetase
MKILKVIREPREILPISSTLERTIKNHPNSIAMQILSPAGWKKWTYKELLDLIIKRANEIKSKGIKKGDRIAIYGPNSPGWVTTYLAIQWIGGIGVPLDNRLSLRMVHYLVNDSEAKLLFTTSDVASEIKEISILIDIPERITVSEVLEREDVSLDNPAVILYTSGTTGAPKGVILTHKNLMSNVEMCYQTMEFHNDEPFYALLPFHHVFPQTINLLAPISTGGTIVIARSYKSNEIKEDCQKSKPVIFPIVPLVLEKFVAGIERELKKLGGLKKVAFGLINGLGKMFNSIKKGSGGRFYKTIRETLGMDNLRYLVSGGAALPNWVSEALEKWGFPVIQGYGLTETSPVISVNPPENPRNESVGLIMPGLEVKIINPDIDGIGEIAVCGPSVFHEFWNNPKATKDVFEGDWFKTGDMGYIDNDSYLYVSGRKKSVIVTKGGKNIYPEEIESYLSISPLIEEIVVVQQTNQDTGLKELVAHIYPNYENIDHFGSINNISEPDPHNILTEEVKKFNKDLADYKRIRRIKLRDEEFPKTTTAKIKRYLFEEEGLEV